MEFILGCAVGIGFAVLVALFWKSMVWPALTDWVDTRIRRNEDLLRRERRLHADICRAIARHDTLTKLVNEVEVKVQTHQDILEMRYVDTDNSDPDSSGDSGAT